MSLPRINCSPLVQCIAFWLLLPMGPSWARSQAGNALPEAVSNSYSGPQTARSCGRMQLAKVRMAAEIEALQPQAEVPYPTLV